MYEIFGDPNLHAMSHILTHFNMFDPKRLIQMYEILGFDFVFSDKSIERFHILSMNDMNDSMSSRTRTTNRRNGSYQLTLTRHNVATVGASGLIETIIRYTLQRHQPHRAPGVK